MARKVHPAAIVAALVILFLGLRPQPPRGPIPLTDAPASFTYKTELGGGLYGGGSNIPPPDHRMRAAEALSQIQPLDAAGIPSPTGRIGFVKLGMSNSNRIWDFWDTRSGLDPTRNPALVYGRGEGGDLFDQDWLPGGNGWISLANSLAVDGGAPAQVQVAWLLNTVANRDAHGLTDFDVYVEAHNILYTELLQKLKADYPNVRLAFFTSRAYAGYAVDPDFAGEPASYETGFAVRRLIQAQIGGEPGLDPSVVPVLLWGPYTWGNDGTPRRDGLTWLPDDFDADGFHLAVGLEGKGAEKVLPLMDQFFHTNEMAAPWFNPPLARGVRR